MTRSCLMGSENVTSHVEYRACFITQPIVPLCGHLGRANPFKILNLGHKPVCEKTERKHNTINNLNAFHKHEMQGFAQMYDTLRLMIIFGHFKTLYTVVNIRESVRKYW